MTHTNEELERFAYAVSHDLREPLRMVTSYVQLFERRYRGKLDAEADELIHYAVDGAKRMQLMINDLVMYSRINTRGKEFSCVDCNTVMDDTILKLEAAIEQSKAKVMRDALPMVTGDQDQLTQLWHHLLDNAIKFHGDDPPEVHVSAKQSVEACQFSVRDNGIGIDTKYADRVFDVFQRLHGHSEYAGTGMGLAICKQIVNRHGGRIWFESEAGKGATFYFTISHRAEDKAPNPP